MSNVVRDVLLEYCGDRLRARGVSFVKGLSWMGRVRRVPSLSNVGSDFSSVLRAEFKWEILLGGEYGADDILHIGVVKGRSGAVKPWRDLYVGDPKLLDKIEVALDLVLAQ